MQHTRVHNAPRKRQHEFCVRNAPEVVRQIRIYDIPATKDQRLLNFAHSLLGVTPGTVGVLLIRKVRFKDGFQHQHCCRHAHPVPESRDTQRPELAVGFRNKHSSDWFRLIFLRLECKRQFTKPPQHAVLLDFLKVLSIHARCSLVRAALVPCMKQNV